MLRSKPSYSKRDKAVADLFLDDAEECAGSPTLWPARLARRSREEFLASRASTRCSWVIDPMEAGLSSRSCHERERGRDEGSEIGGSAVDGGTVPDGRGSRAGFPR